MAVEDPNRSTLIVSAALQNELYYYYVVVATRVAS
jgi:hypothetical protein